MSDGECSATATVVITVCASSLFDIVELKFILVSTSTVSNRV